MESAKNKIIIKDMILIAMFASLTAVLSQISIPLPFTPVPINLAMFSVFVAGGLLGGIKGAISQIIYVLLGVIGVPVFSQFTGGIGKIIGPTGGYIIGYIISAFIIGCFIKKFKRNIIGIGLIMFVGLLGCYAVGTAWFMFVTKTSFFSSLTYCVLPFVLGDILKIVLSAILVERLI